MKANTLPSMLVNIVLEIPGNAKKQELEITGLDKMK